MTLRLFAVYTTWALVPKQCPVFPRSRWTNYDGALEWCGILAGCHNLLEKIFHELFGNPSKEPQPLPSSETAVAPLEAETFDPWDSMFQEIGSNPPRAMGSMQPQNVSVFPQDDANQEDDKQPGDADKPDWVQQKKQNKKKAALWSFSDPLRRLCVIMEVVRILLSCMYDFLFVSGQGFEKNQQVRASKKQQRTFPVLVASENRKVESSIQSLLGLLWRVPQAVSISQFNISLRHMRFRMVSSAICTMHLLLRIPRRGCPCQVFKVLTGGAEELLQVPPCMHDPLAHMVLEQYDAGPLL